MSLKQVVAIFSLTLIVSVTTLTQAVAQTYPPERQAGNVFHPNVVGAQPYETRQTNTLRRRFVDKDSIVPANAINRASKTDLPESCVPNAAGKCCPKGNPNCCDPGCCNPCLRRHRHAIFGDYLLLSATNVDLPYALPQNGLAAVAVLNGPAATAESQYESGFRVGGVYAIDDCTSLMGTYWYFNSSDRDQEFLPGGTSFFRALLTDPGTQNVANDSLQANSRYDIDFQIIDLVARRAIYRSQSTIVNLVAGVRYGHLSQDLVATYQILGRTTVDTDIDFHGIGPRLGIDAEAVSKSGFLVYGNAHANFLVGVFDADYNQSNAFAGPQSFTSYEDSRMVTQLELELGLGWQSECGNYRITAGYYLTSWTNAVTTPVLVRGVQRRRLADLDDSIGFNGLTVRAMIQF